MSALANEAALCRRRVVRAVERDELQGSGLLVQALERAIRAEEQAKAALTRVSALEDSANRITGALSDLRLEVGKVATRVGVYGALGAVLGTVVSSVVAGVIVWFVTHSAAH